MNIGKTLFAQVMEFVPWKTFGRIIERHQGDAGVRTLGCADVFRVLAFAQLTWRESLRASGCALSTWCWTVRHACTCTARGARIARCLCGSPPLRPSAPGCMPTRNCAVRLHCCPTDQAIR